MKPIPWFKNKECLLKLKDFIIEKDFHRIGTSEINIMANHLGLDMKKRVKGEYFHEKKLRLLYLTARSYILNRKAELSAMNIGNYIAYKKLIKQELPLEPNSVKQELELLLEPNFIKQEPELLLEPVSIKGEQELLLEADSLKQELLDSDSYSLL